MPDTEQLIKDIEKIIADMTKTQGTVLAKRLSAAFVAGFKTRKPGSDQLRISELQLRAIKKMSVEQLGYLQEFNTALADKLNTNIQTLVAEGRGYADVRREMIPYIEQTFGDSGTVTIDRTGQTKYEVQVARDGTLSLQGKTITQPFSINTPAYADMLSRTAIHAAYSSGRAEGYKAAGMKKWRYLAMNDDRTRAAHMALTGKVFEIGSLEEELALMVMSEPNCRCRQIPFFDDPGLNKSEETYQKQKDDAGLVWQGGEWVFNEG